VGWSIVSGAQFWLVGSFSEVSWLNRSGYPASNHSSQLELYLVFCRVASFLIWFSTWSAPATLKPVNPTYRQSYFFKTEELPLRLCLFWITRRLVDIIAPLIAFGVLRLRGVAGRQGWRWLFLIEGVFMLSVAIW
jgi:hypothetical protein